MKSSARMFLVKVDGIPDYWANKSGGNITAESGKAYDGGKLKPDIIPGPPQAEDITVTRTYDVERDHELKRDLKQRIGSWTTTLSVTPTNANLEAIATPDTYPGAVLTGVTEPEPDAASGDGATWGLTFSVPDWR